MTYYALIQVGYVIFGVGSTIESARADAAEWLDGGTDAAAQAVVERGLWGAYRVHGALVIVPCSKALAQFVKANGTTEYDEGDGAICLPYELTA